MRLLLNTIFHGINQKGDEIVVTYMKLDIVLKNIGLSKSEAKIYLSLLELGEANLKEIADKAGIPRTSLYTPVRNLTEKGIVEFYKKKGRRYYLASPPEKVLRLYETSLHVFEDNMGGFRKVMGGVDKKPQVRFFEGKEGIKLILNEILEEKRPFLAITCIEDMEKIAHDYFEDFIERRIKQNLKVKLLTNRSRDSQIFKDTDAKELRETRFVPREYRFDTANYIFGDKVAILSLKREPVFALFIEDEAIAGTHRMYFDLIWDMIGLN